MAKWHGNSKKQHQNLESIWKFDPKKIEESEIGRAVGLKLVTPRNVVEKNLALNFATAVAPGCLLVLERALDFTEKISEKSYLS